MVNKKLCADEKKFIDKLHRDFRKTIDYYGLINDGDKILVGLSGGKDSLALLDFLSERQKIFKPHISVSAIHVIMKNIPYHSDLDYLKEFASSRNVNFIVKETEFNPESDKRKTPCFLCSWFRRKMLFSTAKELGFNKIALGHHKDDIIYTMLMNLCFQGSFSTMPPLLTMDKFEMQIIRPMAQINEEDISKMANILNYKTQKIICPYEKKSYRSDMKEILKKLEELNPDVRQSMWNAMENVMPDYLPKKVK